MNKNGQWSDAKTPFKELPFSWVSPTGTAFTWQTRPISWKVGEPTPSSDRRMTYSVTDDEEVLWDNPNPPETNKTSHISRYKRPKWEVDALENGNISDEDAEADQEDK